MPKPAITPRLPRPGDTLAIIAPGSSVTRDAIARGCARLQQSGFKTFYLDSIFERDLYFAGSRERRWAELHEMFQRDDIAGIICARGGYGTNHLLPLDLDLIRKHPKVFMGYSDITTLLTHITDETGLITYHGPMVAKDFADGHAWPDLSGKIEVAAECLRAGNAEGALYGGCLSMLAASLGTPYSVQADETILFLEDVNTKPYQIDRMLMQLKFSGKLERVRGFIFGTMPGCVQPGGQDYSLPQVIQRLLAEYNVPIGYGVPFGHVASPPNLVMPLGIRVSLTVSSKSVSITPA